MAILDRMLRRASRGYLPFSEPRYRGSMPLGPARRFISFKTNTPHSRVLLVPQVLPALRPRSLFQDIEDRRQWHPEGAYRPARSLTESYPQIVARDPGPIDPDVWRRLVPRRQIDWAKMARESQRLAPIRVGWEDPWKMIICLKRKMRREVMHALGMAGKTGFKKPTYTQYSYVRCF